MANANSVYRAKKAAALSNPVTTALVFKQSDDSTKAAFVAAKDIVSGKPFMVRASGTHTTAGAYTALCTIQFTTNVNSTDCATAANNTDAVALTARSISTATRSWYIEAMFVWDSVSQRLTGQKNGLCSETIETASAVITALTSVDFSTNKCGFVVSGLVGTTNASNSFALTDFTLEVL